MNRKVDALSIKAGPTESGATTPPPSRVGGQILPTDGVTVLLQYGILLLLIVVPLAFVLYKKRSAVFGVFSKLQMALWRILP